MEEVFQIATVCLGKCSVGMIALKEVNLIL